MTNLMPSGLVDAAALTPALTDVFPYRTEVVLLAFAISLVIETLWYFARREAIDPRPFLEKLCDFFFGALVERLNRSERGDNTLVARGAIVMIAAMFVISMITAAAYYLAFRTGHMFPFEIALVVLSTSTISWLCVMVSLKRTLNGARKNPYYPLARASYANLTSLDDAGLARHAVTQAIISLIGRTITPVAVYLVAGWPGLPFYIVFLWLSGIAGRAGTDRGFGALANIACTVAWLLPQIVAGWLITFAAFFAAGASFFRGLPALFKTGKWPVVLQGGPVMMIAASSTRLTLGGPYQDRNGQPVPFAWAGPAGTSAKVSARDMTRVAYLLGVMLFIWAGFLLLLGRLAIALAAQQPIA